MRFYAAILKLASVVFIAVAAVHLVLGLGADRMLGAAVPPAVLGEPSLDSQNRFYGVAFAFYGVALYISARDLIRYQPILQAALAVFFLAGCGRVVSIGVHGLPSPLILGLMSTELLLPPALYLWLGRVLDADVRARSTSGA